MTRRSKIETQSGNQPYNNQNQMKYWKLSENDSKCLNCAEFYEKSMRDKYDPSALGVIIQHLAFENEEFSL